MPIHNGARHRIARVSRLRTLAALLVTMSVTLNAKPTTHTLAGTWELERAEIRHADGTITVDPNYGSDAKGVLMVDRDGRYSLQIVRPGRPKFATGDKARGTPEEYRATLLGLSTHTGRISVDEAAHRLVFAIELAAYPNWENTRQVRDYRLADDQLSYQLPPGPDGTSLISVWRRVSESPAPLRSTEP